MKKISLMAIALAMIAGASNAEYIAVQETVTQPNGNIHAITTIEQVKSMHDNTPVVIIGRIVEDMGDEKYMLEDATGNIVVEIEDEEWRGLNITPNDTVKVVGEVDAGMFSTEVDVNYIERM